MKDEATAPETPAQQELEQRLAQLRNQVDDVPEGKRDKLKALWPAFDALRAATRDDSDRRNDMFVRALVDLARVVTTIRRDDPKDVHLGRLTVPPYDLWLPFKAASVASSDKARFTSQITVWNDKIVAHVERLAEHTSRTAGDATMPSGGDSAAPPGAPAAARR